MKTLKIKETATTRAVKRLETVAGWFEDLSPEARKAYIKSHPNSKYAKKGAGGKKAAAPVKKAAPDKRFSQKNADALLKTSNQKAKAALKFKEGSKEYLKGMIEAADDLIESFKHLPKAKFNPLEMRQVIIDRDKMAKQLKAAAPAKKAAPVPDTKGLSWDEKEKVRDKYLKPHYTAIKRLSSPQPVQKRQAYIDMRNRAPADKKAEYQTVLDKLAKHPDVKKYDEAVKKLDDASKAWDAAQDKTTR